MTMKKIVACMYFCMIYFAGHSQGLEKIIVEKYYISDAHDTIKNNIAGKLPAGSVTYRIYVDMLPGYKFQAAFGIEGHELRIETTTAFFNNKYSGGIVANEIPQQNLSDNTVMLDSWLSTGAACENSMGILKTDDNGNETKTNKDSMLQNNNPIAGIPLKERDGLVSFDKIPKVTSFQIDSVASAAFGNNAGSSIFLLNNASWASLYGSKGTTSDNRVLIAQVTTNGIFSFELNIQIGTPTGGVEQYVAKKPNGKEIYRADLSYSSAKEGNNKPGEKNPEE
jgi:hypothetical protein